MMKGHGRIVSGIAAWIAVCVALTVADTRAVVRGQERPGQGGSAVAAPPGAADRIVVDDYTVARQDVLDITVWDLPDLKGKYTIDSNGLMSFPLVGPIPAAGMSLQQVEREIAKRLADGFVRNPRVTVTLDQFRGQRVFVFGGVGAPGTYALGDGMTLIEVLARAGYSAASEVVIVRNKDPKRATGPLALGDASGSTEVIRINLRELEKDVESGVLTRNVVLRDGDTLYVPRYDRNRIFVTGEVRSPGAYSVPDGTTVLQAISLAGGVTEAASVGGARIIRLEDGERKNIRVKMDDIVQPGDTINVPERFF